MPTTQNTTHRFTHHFTATHPNNLLLGYVVALCSLTIALPVFTLPLGYHDFANKVTWGILPNAGDVLSNIPFLFAGIWLWLMLRRHTPPKGEYIAWYVSAFGLALTCFTSGVYHLNPNNSLLAFDRLGMVVAFSGVVGVLLADCISNIKTMPAMLYCFSLGIVTIFTDYYYGNMTPWSVYQAGILGLLILVPVASARLYKDLTPRWNLAWWQIVLIYALAKAAEMSDYALWQASLHILSGHNIKHIIAAFAVLPMLRTLYKLK